MNISNDIQLASYMEEIARRVISKVTKEVLAEFKSQYIEKLAYAQSPRKYIRTWEFRNAWIWSDIEKNANEISTKMLYDWISMPTHNPEKLIHSGVGEWEGEDSRESLAEYLDVKMPKKERGILLFGDRTGRYWQTFMSDYVNSGKLDMVIKKHAKASGLEVSVSY